MWNSIYKRDLTGFFYGTSAYFIFMAYVIVSMILAFFWGMYFFSANHSMYSYFSYQPQVLAILIPAITMRSWAEESKNGTIENLFTFPVSCWDLVSAKFCAAMTISVTMLLFSLPLLITTSFYLDIDWGCIFCSYCGTIMVIAVLTAIGCFSSSLVSMPVAAYLSGLLLGLLLLGFNWGNLFMVGSENLPYYLDGVLDFSRNYLYFLTGQFNLSAIFYFVSTTGLFLLFNWLVVCNRRTRL